MRSTKSCGRGLFFSRITHLSHWREGKVGIHGALRAKLSALTGGRTAVLHHIALCSSTMVHGRVALQRRVPRVVSCPSNSRPLHRPNVESSDVNAKLVFDRCVEFDREGILLYMRSTTILHTTLTWGIFCLKIERPMYLRDQSVYAIRVADK